MIERALIVATVPSMIGQFNMPNIRILLELGYQVDIAADFTDGSVWPAEKVHSFMDQMKAMDVECIQIDFSRNFLKLDQHFQSYNEILKLIRERQYSLIHTHTPIASAIVRHAAYKTRTRVIYTAHGFHFYDGAPIKNWLLFYPIEKHFSRYTDILITINREDYKRAKEQFYAKKTIYIPGIGVDTAKFAPRISGRGRIRKELNVPEDRLVLLSVGELNKNKNHENVIRAISGLPLTYVVVGKGELNTRLEEVAKSCNVDLRLMGFRTDVADFYNAADVYILPSIREGLNVSLMEAMASSLPCLVGRIRGNVDLVEDEGCLFNPRSCSSIRDTVERVVISDRGKIGTCNRKKIKNFDLQSVEKQIYKIYRDEI